MAISLNETTLLNAINGGGLLSVINSSVSPSYGIYYSPLTKTKGKASSYALEPTSFIDVSRVKEASITTAPLEKGVMRATTRSSGLLRLTLLSCLKAGRDSVAQSPILPISLPAAGQSF